MKWIKATLLVSLMTFAVVTFAKTKDNGRPPCATVYTVIQQDTLGNVRQGLSNPKNVKWVDKDLGKKYPDVCYAAPEPSVETVFVIIVTPATYHGTRVETSTETHETPTSGTVTDTTAGSDTYGQQVGTYEGTTTTTSTSSTAVPYSFDYGVFTLTVETFGRDGKPVVRHRFQQKGIYRTYAGVPLGGRGHHPAKALIEDAVKWIHAGGLEDTLQGVALGESSSRLVPISPAPSPGAADVSETSTKPKHYDHGTDESSFGLVAHVKATEQRGSQCVSTVDIGNSEVEVYNFENPGSCLGFTNLSAGMNFKARFSLICSGVFDACTMENADGAQAGILIYMPPVVPGSDAIVQEYKIVGTRELPNTQRANASRQTADTSNAQNSTPQPTAQGTIGVSCDGNPWSDMTE
jgi:hypothetical protein